MKMTTTQRLLGVLLTMLCLISSSQALAANQEKPSKADADSAYAREDYAKAVEIYEQLLKDNGESAELYYNLGNAYYRQDKIASAVLNYERAMLFSPGDADIRFNLEMARSKTVDKVVPESEMFFVSSFRSLVLMMSVDQWARVAVVAFILMLICIGLYLFVPELWAQKLSFAGAVAFLLVCVTANIAALQQRRHIENRDGAIIMVSSIVVKSTPSDSGTDLFILHEGTRVRLIDDAMKEWCEIRVADGKEGWVKKDKLEII